MEMQRDYQSHVRNVVNKENYMSADRIIWKMKWAMFIFASQFADKNPTCRNQSLPPDILAIASYPLFWKRHE